MGKDWGAVADAINGRLEELGMTQRELAERSGVSVATLRQLQHNNRPRRRNPRTLEAVSVGLRLPLDYLARVLEGGDAEPPADAGSLRVAVTELRDEMTQLRGRVDAIEKSQRR